MTSMMIMVVLVHLLNFLNQVSLLKTSSPKIFLIYPYFFIVNFNFLLTHAALNHQSKGKTDASRLAVDMTQTTLRKMSLGYYYYYYY